MKKVFLTLILAITATISMSAQTPCQKEKKDCKATKTTCCKTKEAKQQQPCGTATACKDKKECNKEKACKKDSLAKKGCCKKKVKK